MAYNPPKRNAAFSIQVALEDYWDPGNLLMDPTLEAGDVVVVIDGGTAAELDTLPYVAPSASGCITIELTAAEMNGNVITILFVDQTTPKEWSDLFISIPTTA